MIVKLNINKQYHQVTTLPGENLMNVLRSLGFYGVKHGCETGDCGVCTILLDGKPVNSCLMLAAQVDGREVITIEGVGKREHLHPIQKMFEEAGAVQCGFCGPGVIMSAKALLDEKPDPSVADIRDALSGNLCRCTGYTKMIEAVQDAARILRGETAAKPRQLELSK